MKVSIVMPVYLREEAHRDVVRQTINSIKERSKDYEFIIVNDCSPLDCKEFQRDATTYISLIKNKGISAAWNAGKNEARADYVAIVNDDIRLPFRWLEKLVEGFSDKKTGVTAPVTGGPHIQPFLNSGTYLQENHKFYPGYCFMLKKDRFFEDFDEQFNTNAGDIDYWVRLRKAGWECMRTGFGIWHKEGDVLGKMGYEKLSKESLEKFEKKYGFNPQKEYYT